VHSVMTFVVSTKKNGLYIEPTKHVNKSRIWTLKIGVHNSC
jgi:hypothetical protein